MKAKSKRYDRTKLPIARKPDCYAAQNERGRRQAICLLAIMRAHRAPFLLGRTVGRMVEQGDYGGQEVGFCQAIAEACL